MPGGPSPCGAGGGTLPAQKLTSAEGSQAAARQGKPSSIPLAGAAEPAPLAAQSGPPRPGPAGMPRAPRRRPGPQSPAVVAAAAGPRRLSPPPLPAAPARARGSRGRDGDGTRRPPPQGVANAPTSARRWLRRSPGAGSARRLRSAPLSSAPPAPRRDGPGAFPSGTRSSPACFHAGIRQLSPHSLTHSPTDRPGLAPSPRETTAMGRPHRQPAHGTARYSPPVSESWRSLPEAKGHRFALGLSAKSHHRRLTKKIFIARQFR